MVPRRLFLLLILLTKPVFAAELIGVPTITDGDTVIINGTKIMLLDMDAPETDQFCLDAQGRPWTCGVDAREALKARVKADEWLCAGEKLDRYGRLLASCTVRGASSIIKIESEPMLGADSQLCVQEEPFGGLAAPKDFRE
jgi:endonuclease YncB( thermonuclease family)